MMLVEASSCIVYVVWTQNLREFFGVQNLDIPKQNQFKLHSKRQGEGGEAVP